MDKTGRKLTPTEKIAAVYNKVGIFAILLLLAIAPFAGGAAIRAAREGQ